MKISTVALRSFIETYFLAAHPALRVCPQNFFPANSVPPLIKEHRYALWNHVPMKYVVLAVAVAGGAFLMLYFALRTFRKISKPKLRFSPQKTTESPLKVEAIPLPPSKTFPRIEGLKIERKPGKVIFRDVVKDKCSLKFLHLYYADTRSHYTLYVTTTAPRKNGKGEVLLETVVLPSRPLEPPYLAYVDKFLQLRYIPNPIDQVD